MELNYPLLVAWLIYGLIMDYLAMCATAKTLKTSLVKEAKNAPLLVHLLFIFVPPFALLTLFDTPREK